MELPVYTVCGIYIPPNGTAAEDWNNASYTYPGIDVDYVIETACKDATGTLPNDLRSDFPAAFAFACAHPGTALRIDDGLNWTNLEVDTDRERELHPEPSSFTVCGILLPEWRTVHDYVPSAHGPRDAYGQVFFKLEDRGQFLLAALHHGDVARERRPDGSDFAYADPNARDQATMSLTIQQQWAPSSPIIRSMHRL